MGGMSEFLSVGLFFLLLCLDFFFDISTNSMFRRSLP